VEAVACARRVLPSSGASASWRPLRRPCIRVSCGCLVPEAALDDSSIAFGLCNSLHAKQQLGSRGHREKRRPRRASIRSTDAILSQLKRTLASTSGPRRAPGPSPSKGIRSPACTRDRLRTRRASAKPGVRVSYRGATVGDRDQRGTRLLGGRVAPHCSPPDGLESSWGSPPPTVRIAPVSVTWVQRSLKPARKARIA
jgi:hypothetical protein